MAIPDEPHRGGGNVHTHSKLANFLLFLRSHRTSPGHEKGNKLEEKLRALDFFDVCQHILRTNPRRNPFVGQSNSKFDSLLL